MPRATPALRGPTTPALLVGPLEDEDLIVGGHFDAFLQREAMPFGQRGDGFDVAHTETDVALAQGFVEGLVAGGGVLAADAKGAVHDKEAAGKEVTRGAADQA